MQQQIAGKEKKLGNQAFISKAPAEVVDRERSSLEGLKSQLTRVEEGLAGLQ